MSWRGGVVSAAIVAGICAAIPLASAATALPSPDDLVPNTVARIAEVPSRRGMITKREFRHQIAIAAAAAAGKGLERIPRPGSGDYPKLGREALQFMLEGIWVYGEAAEMGIHVTPNQISRALSRIKKESFKGEAEYRHFLRESHYTGRDVRERVEVQLLSVRLQRRIVGRIEGEARNPAEEQRKLREFVEEFSEKWRSRTVCASAVATDRCSNGPAPA